MKKEHLQKRLQKLAENEVPSASIDLWPGLSQNLVMRKRTFPKQGDTIMNRSIFPKRLIRWAIITGVTAVCFFTLLFATPQGKALAQNILNFFNRNDTNQQVVPLVEAGLQEQPEEPAADPQPEENQETALPEGCGPEFSPRCTLEQAQAEAGFTLLLPNDPPYEINFSSAAILEKGVLLKYESEYGMLLLAESFPDDNAEQTWRIGQDAAVTSTTVRNQPAEYVQGGWSGLGIRDQNLTWDSSIPTRTLRWRVDGVEYTLINFPAQSASGPIGFELAELQQLAEGITAGVEPAPLENGSLALADAEAQAGFEFSEPDWLPAGFIPQKVTYSSQHNSICQYSYTSADTPQLSGLVLGKSGWAMPAVKDLQTKATYNGQEVKIAISQQDMEITGADNGEGLFIETGLQVDAFCGGQPTSANRVLLWQKDAHTYAIFAPLDANDGRGFVTVKEMKRLAESLNGFSTPTDTIEALDPERLLSVKDVESLTGLDIHLPSLMLSNLRFDHISYRGWVTTYYAGQPVGDGRTYHVIVKQTPHSEQTLANLAGGYEEATVNGNPAIYQASCWDSTALVAGSECHQYLIWFDGDTQYDLGAYFPGMIPRETFFAIAESIQ